MVKAASERVKERLIAAYDNLAPLQKAIVQVCSVIYEPTNPQTLLKILLKSGIHSLDGSVSTIKDLASHISQLQNLRLLDKDLRCHEAIVETATRNAVAEGRVLKRGDLLDGVESADRWDDKSSGAAQCAICRNKVSPPHFHSKAGLVCLSCVEDHLRIILKPPVHQLQPSVLCKEGLSPRADLRTRLSTLWNSALILLARVKTGLEGEELKELIVRHVGFETGHPLDKTVRQAAFDVCIKLGTSIHQTLVKLWSTNPSHYYGNIITLAGGMQLESSPLKPLLIEAANDSRTSIRERLLDVLLRFQAPWAVRLTQDMTKDADPTVSRYAKEILAYWGSKGRRMMPTRFESETSVPHAAAVDFGPLVRAIRQELPLTRYSYFAQVKQCPRVMREMRIGLYTGDEKLADEQARSVLTYCGATYGEPHPFVRVCTNPFDPDWFRTLPFSIQIDTLFEAFFYSMSNLLPDEELLTFAMDQSWLDSIPSEQAPKILNTLSARLILAGRISDARRLVTRLGEISHTRGFEGWLRFAEGRYDEAIAAFELELKAERKRLGKRSAYFISIPGIYFILALLNHRDPSSLKKAGEYLKAATSVESLPSFMRISYEALRAILLVRDLQADQARLILEQYSKPSSGFAAFFLALAHYWLDSRLTDEGIDRLSRVFIKAREAGMEGLAMECAQLLRRTEEDTPIRRNYVERVQSEMGIASFVSTLQIEEAWQRSLRALIQATTAGGTQASDAGDVRLVWLFDYEDGEVGLRPLEQKRSAGGTWSKGRPVALSRLYSGSKLEYLSKQDELLRTAVDKEVGGSYYYYGGTEYTFNLDKALPALVGHPLVFLESSPTVPVEIVKGEPEVLVTQSGNDLNIALSMPVSDKAFEVVKESPTRFKVVQLTEEHRRIARILGAKGLNVPFSAKEEVLAAIASISSHVLVHSAIGGSAHEIETVRAEPLPHVHLLPAGSGFRVETFVKPFGDGGPYLKPGVGAENVIAEVNGKRMQATRELKVERRMAAAVEAACPILGDSGGSERQWILEDPEECLQVLLDLRALQEKGQVSVEWPEGEKLRVSRLASFEQLKLMIRGKTNWFEVSGELRVDDDLVLDMRKLLDLLKSSSSRFIPLGEGQFLALTSELRRRLDELEAYAEKKGKDLRLHPLAAMAIEGLTSKAGSLSVDKAWKSRLERIRSAQDYMPTIPSTLKAELRDYQVEGYQWLGRMAYMGMGACLADDMGLGKTIQALAAILSRAANGPTLVVAPTSVCMNWITEANRFAPTLNVTLFGSQDREKLVKGLGPMDLLISSYGLMHQESELLSSVEWNTIVLDEAQAIKNVLTKRAQAAMSLRGEFKLITTGTPIENHLSELWTLFNFINPGLLGSHTRFNERFALPVERYNDREARKRLRKLIQPFILRRVKAQVLEELPPRTEVVLQVEMSPEETAFYEALRRQALDRLAMDSSPLVQKQLKILAEITKLRQAACNPRLVTPETELSSSKLEVFGEVVSELIENRHKALVFSQFVGHLSLIRQYLDERGINYRYLDGSTPPKDRKREVDEFQSGNGDLFLISLKAGGLGLNLTAADYVIHMDPWWNPAVEDQASDRAHRIGQQHPVTIYRLVTRHTIEEKIVKLHQEKRDLAGSLLEGSDISGKISAEELLRLIKEE